MAKKKSIETFRYSKDLKRKITPEKDDVRFGKGFNNQRKTTESKLKDAYEHAFRLPPIKFTADGDIKPLSQDEMVDRLWKHIGSEFDRQDVIELAKKELARLTWEDKIEKLRQFKKASSQ